MTITPGSLLLLDTNVLLAATDVSRDSHLLCTELFRLPARTGVHLVTIGPILREYLVVATRPVEVNGLGLHTTDAVRNIRAFRTRTHLLPESPEVHRELVALVEAHALKGKRIHDANLAAAAGYHHVSAIVTDSTDDYAAISPVPVISSRSAVDALRAMR